MPVGLLVIVPEPVPDLETVRGYVFKVNAAFAVLLEFIVTVQLPVPEQAPDQPEKVEPEEGVAIKVTGVPESMVTVPVLPIQLITPVEEVISPEPVPEPVSDLVMVRV